MMPIDTLMVVSGMLENAYYHHSRIQRRKIELVSMFGGRILGEKELYR